MGVNAYCFPFQVVIRRSDDVRDIEINCVIDYLTTARNVGAFCVEKSDEWTFEVIGGGNFDSRC